MFVTLFDEYIYDTCTHVEMPCSIVIFAFDVSCSDEAKRLGFLSLPLWTVSNFSEKRMFVSHTHTHTHIHTGL